MLVFLKLRKGVIEVWEHFFSTIPDGDAVFNVDKIPLPNEMPEAIATMQRAMNGDIRSGVIQNIDELKVEEKKSNVIKVDFVNKRRMTG